MAPDTSNGRPGTLRLIGIPVFISLAVIGLQIVWDVRHPPGSWSEPHDPFSSLAWLVPVFGIYFALRIGRSGAAPASLRRGFLFATIGVALLVPGLALAFVSPNLFITKVSYGLLLIAAAAFLQALVPPQDFFWTLLAYAYAVRIPVVTVIFLSLVFSGLPAYGGRICAFGPAMGVGSLTALIVMAVLPQLVMWVGFTVVVGSLFGHIGLAAARVRTAAPQGLALRRRIKPISTVLGVTSLATVVVSMFLVSTRAPYELCQWAFVGQVLSPLVAILAVVLGHLARHKRGYVFGYVSLLLFVPISFSNRSFPPCGERPFYSARSAVGALRTINTSEVNYASTYSTGFSQTLQQLDGTSAPFTAEAAGFIDSVLASGQKSGYTFDYKPGPPDAQGKITSYAVGARPIAGGHPNYFTDETGVIRQTTEDRPATAKDPPLAP